MGRQRSDDDVVPERRRTTRRARDGEQGKVVTVNERAKQLELFAETAGNLQGAEGAVATSPLVARRIEVPKSVEGEDTALPPMTLEHRPGAARAAAG